MSFSKVMVKNDNYLYLTSCKDISQKFLILNLDTTKVIVCYNMTSLKNLLQPKYMN